MREWQSQSHVRWWRRNPVVVVPKCRRRSLYGMLRSNTGTILRELCRRHQVELVEGQAMSEHIRLCLSVPPKYGVANTAGFLKVE
jgi:putative transposase